MVPVRSEGVVLLWMAGSQDLSCLSPLDTGLNLFSMNLSLPSAPVTCEGLDQAGPSPLCPTHLLEDNGVLPVLDVEYDEGGRNTRA